MNDGKSIVETEALPLAGSGSGPTASPSKAEGMDLRRRRLIRGAAGIAPVVLTLRSSGVAAAISGCAAVVMDNVTLEADGQIPSPTNISPGYVCVKEPHICGTSPSGPKAIQYVNGTTTTGTVTLESSKNYCKVGGVGGTPMTGNVVIISSAASIVG